MNQWFLSNAPALIYKQLRNSVKIVENLSIAARALPLVFSYIPLKRLAYTAISRKVFEKNVRATIPKGNMGYDQYSVPNDCSCRTYFCCFPLALAHISMAFRANSFKFLWKTENSKPPTMPFGIVACTFSDNLSRNSCMVGFFPMHEVLKGLISRGYFWF